MDRTPIKRALISVYDKTGLVDLGKTLVDAGVSLVSTGGSYAALAQAGIFVAEIVVDHRDTLAAAVGQLADGML